jgi:hypothetical protein
MEIRQLVSEGDHHEISLADVDDGSVTLKSDTQGVMEIYESFKIVRINVHKGTQNSVTHKVICITQINNCIITNFFTSPDGSFLFLLTMDFGNFLGFMITLSLCQRRYCCLCELGCT